MHVVGTDEGAPDNLHLVPAQPGLVCPATIACDLLCRLRLLCLDGPLARAEPKTLRYRLLHTAARLVRGQRKRKIKIPKTWPWARELEACFLTIFALPPPA